MRVYASYAMSVAHPKTIQNIVRPPLIRATAILQHRGQHLLSYVPP
jgi:hypothetical protein